MQYRRARVEGGTFFFTAAAHLRRRFLCERENVDGLREAVRSLICWVSFLNPTYGTAPLAGAPRSSSPSRPTLAPSR